MQRYNYCTYPASELEEDAERREDDGDDDVDAVRRPFVRHGRCLSKTEAPLPFLSI
jgi:hypothetical protein